MSRLPARQRARSRLRLHLLVPLALGASAAAQAQWVEHRSVSTVTARQLVAACEDYAAKHHWHVAIWVLDEAGIPTAFARMEGAPSLAVQSAQDKARTALAIGHPSGELGQGLEQGHLQILALNLFPMAGGLPISSAGTIVGAIGVGGAQSSEDEQCAKAALDQVLGKPLTTP